MAIVLAAGQGKRMCSEVPKQYLLIEEKPVLYYSLKAFQDSFVDEIILVTAESEIEYCKAQIVQKYSFDKVTCMVVGGKERYHSVYNGIMALKGGCDYIFIHDGARPFLTQKILNQAYICVRRHDACVVGMPVKDTIKIVDADGFAASTPDRNRVWMMQTPQVFSFSLIKKAYSLLIEREKSILEENIRITDDAMVVETLTDRKVKMVEGSYENIKITTPEDLIIAEAFLKKQ